MEAAAPLATLFLGPADGVSSESDGPRISLDGGSTGGAGIARSQSLESVFDRTRVARPMVIPESAATSVLN